MCESRAVRSEKVYRQLFEAQVQLSRSLLAGRRDTRTDCLSAEDSNTHSSTASRWLCPLSSRGQQPDADEDVDDVGGLPDTLVVDRPSSDIIKHLTEKKSKQHKDALKQMETELTEVTLVCETQVRTVSLELLSSLQEMDLRLDTLKDRMEQLEHLERVGVQEVYVLWEEVEEEMKLRKIRIMELNHKLTKSESQRIDQVRAVLRKFCHWLEKIGFLPPPDVCRLIHTEATMLNQSLLANRRSAAHLLLLLREESLQQESLLRLHWEDCLSHWRRSRVNEVIESFRTLCSSDEEQQLVSDQQTVQMMKQTQRQRCDIIDQMCSLVPPSCSTALVSDWFNQLTTVNQRIDSLHVDFIQQLRRRYEQTWQDRLAEVERCEEALSALQLSEEEVNNIVSSQLLTLIGRSQNQDEERLAALDLCCDSVARRALSLTRCVFVVMKGAALLWETHSCRLAKREEKLQQHLDNLRDTQQQHIQRKKVHLDDLLAELRQQSSEDALKTSLDKTVRYLQDIKHSWSECVSEQCRLLDRLPSVSLEELLSYSSSLHSFYHLRHTCTQSPEEPQNLDPSAPNPEPSEGPEVQKREQVTDNHPISWQNDTDPAQPSQDWLTEAESSLLELCDINSDVILTSSRGVAYIGPSFRCPAPNLPHGVQQETHLSVFPVELLIHTLSRTRMLFLDHLKQHFHDVLSSAAAMATDKKEAVRLEQELHLQHLNPHHIETHICQPRLLELQLHRRRVDAHCEEVLDILTSCRVELQELQTSISRKNQEFTIILSSMEDDVLTADGSRRVDTVSAALQLRLDQHIRDVQRCKTVFRQTVQVRLEEVRDRTTRLLDSFRLFSEGGDFSPKEVKLFQRRLKEETKRISMTEESIFSQLEAFESSSLQQVKETSGRLQEKLSLLKSEVTFREKTQTVINSTHLHIRAEAARSNQQQSVISSRLQDLRTMLENTQVSPGQVCSVLSSVNEDLTQRCQYLDFSLERPLQDSLSAHPESSKRVRSAPPPDLLQPSRTGVDLLSDPVVAVIKSLNSVHVIQDAAEEDEGGRASTGQSPAHQQRGAECVGMLSVRRGCRSIRTDTRFQVFGPEPESGPEPEQSTRSFSSTLSSVLWKANNVLLLVAEDFYQSQRCASSRFLLVPDTLDQWAESTQLRLLGYQEQARVFLSQSREEVVSQLSVLEELLHVFPVVLISNHEQQQGAELKEELGGVRRKLEETLSASEKKKRVNVRQLRASLREDERLTLNSREELRQQQLHSAVCCAHLELQERLRVKGEEFVTSLACLTESLLSQLDDILTPEETEAALSHWPFEDSTVSVETGAETGQKPCPVSRTWSGIPYLSLSTDPPSSVTMAITASITTTRCTMGHLAVIEQRDAAVKRFEQLFRSEWSHSDDDKQRRLRELQSWNTHWRQQIHTLTHTVTHTHWRQQIHTLTHTVTHTLETADTHSDTHCHTHTGDSRYTL